jgi:Skp family chaperone for outer membrane proteins
LPGGTTVRIAPTAAAPAMPHRLAVPHSLLLAALFAAAASAQKPTFEWQKRAASIDYGSVPLGKHSLAELPIGGSWRLGANQATVLRLAMPAIVGEAVVAPGAYTVQLQRTGEVACSLVSGEGVRIDGPLGKAAKPTKKLVIDWLKDGAPKASSQAAKLVVQFGDNEWSGGMTFPGSTTVPAGSRDRMVTTEKLYFGGRTYDKGDKVSMTDAEARLNDARAQAKTDLDGRLETLKSNMEAINKLEADAKKPELTPDKQQAAIRTRDEKINEVRNLDREIGEFRQTRERQLQEQFMRMRGDIVQDIMKIVDAKVKAEGFELVFDKSGQGISQVPVVLFSAPSMDFSDSLITELNKNAPAKKD